MATSSPSRPSPGGRSPAAPPAVPIDEDAELAALRKLLSAGPRTNRLRPAALSPGQAAAQQSSPQQQQQAGSSTTRLLQLLQDRSGIDEARPMLEAELAQREAKLGPKHADTLLSCTCLAMLLQAKGELAAARPVRGPARPHPPSPRRRTIRARPLTRANT